MQDQYGNHVIAASSTVLAAYERAVDAQLHAWPGVQAALDEALAESPDFALAQGLQALVHAVHGRGAQAREVALRALALPGLMPRESSQLGLIAAMLHGRTVEALNLLLAHVRAYPTDVLAVSTGVGAYGLFAFSGRADHDAARLEFLEALAPHYPVEFPWLLANRGWARIELGRVEEGLTMSQRAISLRPANGHNAHIVMHGLYEAADPQAALDFVTQWLRSYPDDAILWGHLHWHAALSHIALGQIDLAMQRLLGPIASHLPRGFPFMGVPDIVSLLWRLGLLKVAALPWALAQQHVAKYFPQGSNVFGEIHCAMLAAATRDTNALEAVQQRLQRLSDGGHAGAPVAQQFALGLSALLNSDEATARAHLDACMQDRVRLGGSHAQRDVVELTRDALRVPQAQMP